MLLLCVMSTRLFAETNIITETFSVTNSVAINEGAHLALTLNQIVESRIRQITKVTVSLRISGDEVAANGDFFCALYHGTNGVPLLNRVGRRASSHFGYPDNGIDVIFDDNAPNGDIHTYRRTLFGSDDTAIDVNYQTPLMGIWAPDGRWGSSRSALDTDERTAFLSVFNESDPNGNWVLVLSDESAGAIGKLDSWSITISGYPGVLPARPSIRLAFEVRSGVDYLHFFISGAMPGIYAVQGSKDLQEWKNISPGLSISNRDADFDFAVPKTMVGENIMFRIIGL